MIQVLDIPFVRPDDDKPEQQLASAVRALNDHVEQNGLQVVSVETVIASRFLGFGQQPVGLRARVRAA